MFVQFVAFALEAVLNVSTLALGLIVIIQG